MGSNDESLDGINSNGGSCDSLENEGMNGDRSKVYSNGFHRFFFSVFFFKFPHLGLFRICVESCEDEGDVVQEGKAHEADSV